MGQSEGIDEWRETGDVREPTGKVRVLGSGFRVEEKFERHLEESSSYYVSRGEFVSCQIGFELKAGVQEF